MPFKVLAKRFPCLLTVIANRQKCNKIHILSAAVWLSRDNIRSVCEQVVDVSPQTQNRLPSLEPPLARLSAGELPSLMIELVIQTTFAAVRRLISTEYFRALAEPDGPEVSAGGKTQTPPVLKPEWVVLRLPVGHWWNAYPRQNRQRWAQNCDSSRGLRGRSGSVLFSSSRPELRRWGRHCRRRLIRCRNSLWCRRSGYRLRCPCGRQRRCNRRFD